MKNIYFIPNHFLGRSQLLITQKMHIDFLTKVHLVFLTSFLSFFLTGQNQKGLDINGEVFGDNLGMSVSMPNPNTLAIGAPRNDGNGNDAGHVRIFSWDGVSWTQKGLDINGEDSYDLSGWSVSMPDSITVAIGAHFNDGNGAESGHVRIYAWDGNSRIQKGLDINGEYSSDQSGYSVSMPDANTVAIGAPKNDNVGNNAGHVRIYTWDGYSWIQKGLDINGEYSSDQSGYSVSMPDANTVAIGAPRNYGSGASSRHVRIYSWDGVSWTQKGADIDGEASGDESGCSVSMPNANTVAIGATENDGNGYSVKGHVRIYSWNGSNWSQKGMDIDGEASGDRSGHSVSMPDANTVAIGAPWNQNRGHVRIHAWDGNSWYQVTSDLNAKNIHDNFGFSVSMPDANTVAIGAQNNDEVE